MNAAISLLLTGIVATLPPAARSELDAGTQKFAPVESVLLKALQEVQVPARQAGALAVLGVCEGQVVEALGELGHVEDEEQRVAVDRARIELDIARQASQNDVNLRYAQKCWEMAKNELARAQESQDTYAKSVSATEIARLTLARDKAALEMEQAERDLQVARFNEALKQTELETALLDVARRRIIAPITGIVVQIHRQQGEWLQPGEPVLRLVRVDRLRADGFVHQKYVKRCLEGRAVELRVDLGLGPSQTFPGKVIFASPEVDPVNGQFLIRAEIDNRALILRPGQHATMTIEIEDDVDRADTVLDGSRLP